MSDLDIDVQKVDEEWHGLFEIAKENPKGKQIISNETIIKVTEVLDKVSAHFVRD